MARGMWKSLAAVAALSLFASGADAQPRKRETARWLSLGGVIGSAAIAGTGAVMTEYALSGGRGYDQSYGPTRRAGEGLMIAGAVTTLVTPSLGDWYAGEYLTTGVKLRAAGLGVGLVGVGVYFAGESKCQQFGDSCYGGSGPNVSGASVAFAAGGALYLAGAIYDVVHAPTAADERFQIVPAVIASAHGPTTGVGIGGRF